MQQRYLLKTFAKINLSLLVFKPNQRGYHPLCSVFQTISLHDDLVIQLKPERGISLSCENTKVPIDQSNLLVKIYNHLAKPLSFGVDITLDKKIPLGGGLGGGSSNAAGFLLFLNQIARLNISKVKLCSIGLKYGADIPFFINGGTALVRGIGEKIKQITENSPRYFLLINPNIHVATKKIFQNFDYNENLKPAVKTPGWVLKKQLGINDLQATAFKLYPALASLAEEIKCFLHTEIYMSGSGATLFVPFATKKEAQKAAGMLLANFKNIFVYTSKKVPYSYQIFVLD